MSTGKTYEISGETTEWEDILIKKGIRTREEVLLEKGLNPSDVRADTDFSSLSRTLSHYYTYTHAVPAGGRGRGRGRRRECNNI
jgi:hypothetical protein